MMIEKALQAVKDLFPAFYAENGLPLAYILRKFARVELVNNFGSRDIYYLNLWQNELTEKLLFKHQAEARASLVFMSMLLQEVLEDIQAAFAKRKAIVRAASLREIERLDDELLTLNPKSDIEEINNRLACGCHDLYWDFYNPFETMIDFPSFIEMFRGEGGNERHMLEQLALLDSLQRVIISYGKGMQWERLLHSSDKMADLLLAHKIAYLRRCRSLAQQEWQQKGSKIPFVLIVGAGPGGLMRTLVALIKGVEVQTLEKRCNFTQRRNVIKLRKLPMLDLFGISCRLVISKQVYPIPSSDYYVSLGDLQRALLATVRALQDDDSLLLVGYTLHHIGVEVGHEGKPIALAHIGEPNSEVEVTKKRVDYIVDASGGQAVVAKMVGNEAQVLAKKNVIVIGMFKDVVARTGYIEKQKLRCGVKQLSLPAPGCWCELVVPDRTTQIELMRLAQKGSDYGKMDDSTALTLETNTEQEKRLLISSIALEAVQRDSNLQQNPPITMRQLIDAWMVEIVMQQRAPAAMIGPCMVQQSGDALVLSDPLAAAGGTIALRGAALFSKSLEPCIDLQACLTQRYAIYVYGAQQHTRFVVEKSFRARGEAGKNWGLACDL